MTQQRTFPENVSHATPEPADEFGDLLRFAKDLADPDWCLSVPVTAKQVIARLVAIIEAKP